MNDSFENTTMVASIDARNSGSAFEEDVRDDVLHVIGMFITQIAPTVRWIVVTDLAVTISNRSFEGQARAAARSRRRHRTRLGCL
jgi:hypothetical protein